MWYLLHMVTPVMYKFTNLNNQLRPLLLRLPTYLPFLKGCYECTKLLPEIIKVSVCTIYKSRRHSYFRVWAVWQGPPTIWTHPQYNKTLAKKRLVTKRREARDFFLPIQLSMQLGFKKEKYLVFAPLFSDIKARFIHRCSSKIAQRRVASSFIVMKVLPEALVAEKVLSGVL